MDRVLHSVDAVRAYLQKRIDSTSRRIALGRKPTGAKPRRGMRQRTAEVTPALAERRAYRDALRALDSMRPEGAAPAAVRLAAEELERVKGALARIYEVTQHADHDIADAGDWAIVEGEAQTALNVVHEAEKNQ
jgi:hypothetical protein